MTHHLEVLPYADHIVVMDSDGMVGKIAQQGSYQVSADRPFARKCGVELTNRNCWRRKGRFNNSFATTAVSSQQSRLPKILQIPSNRRPSTISKKAKHSQKRKNAKSARYHFPHSCFG